MTTQAVKSGHLYVVATPIGNRDDLSPRALKILNGVNLIAAEDTRVTGALLAHFGVRTKMIALHEHNEDKAAARVLDALQEGKSVALVSDAGTPLISDPGFPLVRMARAARRPVLTVPGPSAGVAALSVSGMSTDRFMFAGFLPAKRSARRQRLQELAAETCTVVLYESPHRIGESLQAIVEAFGAKRSVCLARELTKRFEESHTAAAAELLEWFKADGNRQRGEFVLVIEGAAETAAEPREAERVLGVLLPELGAARAAKVASQLTGLPRKVLYAMALDKAGARPKE
ncbi:MAG: 16S rRNA (cytidine(1402)-2'-O)-methyltransferase [Nevskiales bacterium]|nr:16S rRNA (cytidine(1402)-2'-O)-methyltransferase [Nevskiales bacterium]